MRQSVVLADSAQPVNNGLSIVEAQALPLKKISGTSQKIQEDEGLSPGKKNLRVRNLFQADMGKEQGKKTA